MTKKDDLTTDKSHHKITNINGWTYTRYLNNHGAMLYFPRVQALGIFKNQHFQKPASNISECSSAW